MLPLYCTTIPLLSVLQLLIFPRANCQLHEDCSATAVAVVDLHLHRLREKGPYANL